MSRVEIVSETMMRELSKPYEYGVADCFMMGCAVVDALQGTSHSATYANCYTTMIGAKKVMVKKGCKSLSEFVATELKLEPVTPAFCRIGDLAILEITHADNLADAVAIFNGMKFTTKTEAGSASYSFDAVKAAFKV